MKLTVHRIEIPVAHQVDVHLPGFRRALHVAESRTTRDNLEVWFEVDTEDQVHHDISITMHGTGRPIWHRTGRPWAEYLGTVIASTELVWHVYTVPTEWLVPA